MNLLPLLSRSAAALLALPLLALAQGSLLPPGSPLPTMRTLDQLGTQLDDVQRRVDSLIAVNSANTPGDAGCMYQITRPGSYYLPGNVEIDGVPNGVLIAASGVTLDLNGYTISAPMGGGAGVLLSGVAGLERIVVRNGRIAGTSGGVYGGTAAMVSVADVQLRSLRGPGVFLAGADCLVRNVQVSGALYYGVELLGAASLVVDCTVTGITNPYDSTTTGIHASIVRHCVVDTVPGTSGEVNGIRAQVVEGCSVRNLSSSSPGDADMLLGISGTTVRGCEVSSIGSTAFVGVEGIRGDYVADCAVATVKGRNPYGINGAAGTVRGCRVSAVAALAGAAQGSTEAYGIRAHETQGCSVTSVVCSASAYGVRGDNVSGCGVSDVTGRTPSGIASSGNVIGCQVRGITANSGSPATYGISASGTVSDCTVASIVSPSPNTVGIYGATVRSCRLYDIGVDAGSSGGFASGIFTSLAGVVEGNSVQAIRNVGIAPGQGAVVRGNAIFEVGNVTGVVDGKGIVGLTGCRIEGNTIGGNAPDYGIVVGPGATGCLIVGNQCSGPYSGAATNAGLSDTGAFNIANGNRLGPILTSSGVITTAMTSLVNIAN